MNTKRKIQLFSLALLVSFAHPTMAARMSMPGTACHSLGGAGLQTTTTWTELRLGVNVMSASIVCPIYRVGNTITDAWLNINVETATPGGKMQCQLVRKSVAKGLPPSKEQFTVDIPIDVKGVLDFKLPEFASNAGSSDVYVLGCMLKPGIEILGYNWEGQ